MSSQNADLPFLRGGGDMGQRARAFDWTVTPLGAPSSWPLQMATLISVLLEAGQPMFLAWGAERTLIYNDAYAPLLGGKHPCALGRPFLDVWAEVAADLMPLFDQVFAGDPVHMDDIALHLDRGDGLKEAHFAFSYTPVRDDGGAVVGLFCPCMETTESVATSRQIANERERQLAMLRQMPGFVAMLAGPEHVYTYVNDAYVRIAGERDFVGRRVRDVLPELAGHSFYELLDQVYTTGERFIASALPFDLAGASESRFIDFVYEPIRDDDGVVTGIFVGGYDISERVAAEHALRAAETSAAQVLDATSEAFYAVDCDGRTTLCNAAFVEMLGFDSREAVIGRALHGLIHHSHPDGSPYARDDCPIYHAAAAGVAAHVADEVFFRLDGTAFPVEYRAEPIVLDGVLSGAICTFTDITERKAAQAALAASEAQFRTFAQAMPNHVWSSSPDGMLDWFNQRVYDYSGLEGSELDGTGWTTMVDPADLPAAAARWAASLGSGQIYEAEFRLRRADGAYRWHLARAVAIRDKTERIVRWIGTNTDIHDQKATADELARLNASLEQEVADRTADRDRMWRNSQDLLLVLDLDGVFRSISPSVEATLGWSADEMVGHSLFEFLLPEDESETREGLRLLARGIGRRVENRYRHRNGGFRWLAWIATAEEGLVYATGRDITAEKEASFELAEVQQALRQSQKMEAVGQLTGGIAHDFNNLLAGISGSLEVIERRIAAGRTDGLDRFINGAQSSAQRAAALTQRLLAFSRRQTLDPKPTDVNRLVFGMEDLIRRTVGPSIKVEVVGAGGLWPARIDAVQLESALLNLAINARDAMPEGGRLTIETANKWLDDRSAVARDVPAGQYLSICVTDSGTGIPKDVVERIFDPFFTTKPIGQGTGLGLSMIHGFVRQSGGQVRVYTEDGQGTTMCLYLPRYIGDVAEDERPPEAISNDGTGCTVLVIDDEATVRMLIVEVLEEAGYTALEADDGPSGLKLLQSTARIDLLITDVGLPGGMNGRQIADAARESRPELKILFVTGYAENAAVGNGHLDAGMEVMTKPFVMTELGNKIAEMLGS